MYGGEFFKVWLERLPFCAFIGALVSGVGLGILVWFRNQFIEITQNLTRKFYDGRDSCSLLRGNKVFWILFYCYLCVTGLVIAMGFIANGDIRARIFRYRTARICGAVICGFLTCLTIALICGYIRHAEFYSQYYFYALASEIECDLYQYRTTSFWCQFHTQGNILLDEEGNQDFRVCSPGNKLLFCNKYYPEFKSVFVKLYASFCVIIVGLVIYCMCLAADYVKIRCQAKFQELEDLRSLELDMSSKDRL